MALSLRGRCTPKRPGGGSVIEDDATDPPSSTARSSPRSRAPSQRTACELAQAGVVVPPIVEALVGRHRPRPPPASTTSRRARARDCALHAATEPTQRVATAVHSPSRTAPPLAQRPPPRQPRLHQLAPSARPARRRPPSVRPRPRLALARRVGLFLCDSGPRAQLVGCGAAPPRRLPLADRPRRRLVLVRRRRGLLAHPPLATPGLRRRPAPGHDRLGRGQRRWRARDPLARDWGGSLGGEERGDGRRDAAARGRRRKADEERSFGGRRDG